MAADAEPNAAGLFEGADGRMRCAWCRGDDAYIAYHDREWGRPVADETRLFEKVCLEGFQSGLSWLTILRKRAAFRAAFAGFEIERVAAFGPEDAARILADPGVVRHRGKIAAAIANARAALELRAAGESLAAVIWGHAPREAPPAPRALAEVPALTAESAALSKRLKAAGFKFVGPTTMYALMQSMGVVNDHLEGCALRAEVAAERAAFTPPS